LEETVGSPDGEEGGGRDNLGVPGAAALGQPQRAEQAWQDKAFLAREQSQAAGDDDEGQAPGAIRAPQIGCVVQEGGQRKDRRDRNADRADPPHDFLMHDVDREQERRTPGAERAGFEGARVTVKEQGGDSVQGPQGQVEGEGMKTKSQSTAQDQQVL